MISVFLCLVALTPAITYGAAPSHADGKCIPHRTYQVECNSCICTPNRKLGICTVPACIGSEAPKCSIEGDTKEDFCSSCLCVKVPSGETIWACTTSAECEDVAPFTENPERKRRATQECQLGETKYEDCNPCQCTQDSEGNTSWSCTRQLCLAERVRRDVNLAGDFKDTPCAPNDSFELPNCITCYCNSAKTGYLCGESQCPGENSTESKLTTKSVSSERPLAVGSDEIPANESTVSRNPSVKLTSTTELNRPITSTTNALPSTVARPISNSSSLASVSQNVDAVKNETSRNFVDLVVLNPVIESLNSSSSVQVVLESTSVSTAATVENGTIFVNETTAASHVDNCTSINVANTIKNDVLDVEK